MFHFRYGQPIRFLQVSFFIAVWVVSFWETKCYSEENEQSRSIRVHGAVIQALNVSACDLKEYSPFHINNVSLIKEKGRMDGTEEITGVFNFKGVLLRDILENAGMTHKRKWEPLVYIRVRGPHETEIVFSFGEIFYSSIGRSILIADERNGAPINSSEGLGELIVSTDIRDGRRAVGIKEIIVERANIQMVAYEDKKKKVVRPPTKQFTIVESQSGNHYPVTANDLAGLPSVLIEDAVITGDCEGFKDVFSFEGPLLRSLLEKHGIGSSPQRYDRYVAISSADGFSAAFSFGEIFNSRLGNNIIIAIRKDGRLLGPKDGFAMSVVGEDSAGGRSVKRIKKVEVF